MQHDSHVACWKRFTRYQNVWYRGKVSRMTQLKALKARGDLATYEWLKDFWRVSLTNQSHEPAT